MKRVWIIAFVVLVAVSIGTCGVSMADTAQDRAIRAAREAAQSRGIIVGEAEIIYDADNKKWEERVAAIEQLPADPNHGKLPHGMLYNKKYETVLLDFKEDATDADVWVFIDKDTGDVLTIYQEER